jgi:hypothetical protein
VENAEGDFKKLSQEYDKERIIEQVYWEKENREHLE